ncbi:MAG: hypothetical protein JJU29_12690 [Verrucomicrobia bacterium]|nr:hypothetical protein [Verrucomicrobiota bacterium]
MSTTLSYKLNLISDAEPGSGLGTELVNSLITRDHLGNPMLRGSHMKGLLREQLRFLLPQKPSASEMEEILLGKPGDDQGSDGQEGLLRVPDLKVQLQENKEIQTREISRTALNALGSVKSGSLRTTEAVPAGTVFSGDIHFRQPVPLYFQHLVKSALMSIPAVGGGRTRGSGACWISFHKEARSPGELLELFLEECKDGQIPTLPAIDKQTIGLDPKPAMAWVRFRFHAEEPVCCPETPGTRNLNVISTGIDIPASAVLGGIISRIAQTNDELATATLNHPQTRFWPLLPVPDSESTPVRVALSHRMSKLKVNKGEGKSHLFKDAAVEPYRWDELPKGTTMKGSDGVLLVDASRNIRLWKSGEIPRVYSSHSVHNGTDGERNLFTLEALAPTEFAGMAYLPEAAVETLRKNLERPITFGKSRSIRGGGKLEVETFTPEFNNWKKRIWVLQSPVALPDDLDQTISAEAWMNQLLEDSGWGELDDSPRNPGELRVENLANCAVRFGWNRHGIGHSVGGKSRLRARKVFLPGSVFVLKEAPENILECLARGLGQPLDNGDCDGRTQGYGAVLPHPGCAMGAYHPEPKITERKSRPSGQMAMTWFLKTKGHGPSPSQISAVAEKIQPGNASVAKEYLEKQLKRAPRVWERWKFVAKDIEEAMSKDAEASKQALRTWRDLVIANNSNK